MGETKYPFAVKTEVETNPKILLLFGKTKIGKSTILSGLDGCLTLEFEDKGSDYMTGHVVQVNSLKDLNGIGKQIEDAGKPYKYIAIDTVTALEDMCLPYANQLYRATPMGKNWNGEDVRTLPSGSGYQYLRTAFFNVIDKISTWAEFIILVGHLKDTLIEKDGEEFNSYELDLTGKIKRITAANAAAVGYVYRDGNKLLINFKPSEDILAGCKIPRLEGKIITISEKDKNSGAIRTFWNEIYI